MAKNNSWMQTNIEGQKIAKLRKPSKKERAFSVSAGYPDAIAIVLDNGVVLVVSDMSASHGRLFA